MSGTPSIQSDNPAFPHTTCGDPPSFPSGCSHPTFDGSDNENEYCEAENNLRRNANSTKVLVAMCIGLMDKGGKNPLIDIT